MKIIRTIAILSIVIMLTHLTLFPTHASSSPSDIIYFSDGSYMTVSLLIQDARSNNKSASKTYTYYNVANTEQWSATLSASFEFDGTEYWATEASMDVSIKNSSWYVISKSATFSGCGATGEITMGHKVLGIKTAEKSATITLSCSPYGTIS